MKWNSSIIKATGGGGGGGVVKKYGFRYVLYLNIIFFKSGSQYNYYTCANFKSRYLKTTLGTFFEKTMHGRGPKLCSCVPLMSFNKKIFF